MREGLAIYVAGAEQPFTFAADARLERWIKNYVQPGFSSVSRNTNRSDVSNVFISQKNLLKTEFHNHVGAISFTSDMWTGVNDLGFLSLTAHYVDPTSWVMHKRIIALRMIPFPHTRLEIYKCISSIFTEYNISNKCFSITFENHSANTNAIDNFKRARFVAFYQDALFHVRCVCHIIARVVNDGMDTIKKDEELDFIRRIRDAIKYITTGSSRVQKYSEICTSNRLNPRKLMLDCGTRWNSTYLMLKACEGYEKAIIEYVMSSADCVVNLEMIDFEVCSLFMTFLETFYDATNVLSGIYYPTSHIVINQLYNMTQAFVDCRGYDIYDKVLYAMELKFKKYFEPIPPIYYLASIMDPRKKLQHTMVLITKICENLNIPVLDTVEKVMEKLSSLFTHYENIYGSNVQRTNVITPRPHTKTKDLSWSLLANASRGCGPLGVSSSNVAGTRALNDLEKYLQATTVDNVDDFDILGWWRLNGINFPVVQIMARDLLTPPASTVASESTFSACGRVLDEKRSRLKSEMLESLICVKDWDDAKYRDQAYTDEIAVEFERLGVIDD
ncbi:zinc finger BED domain-containing protein RICESLEEPER 2-like [Papaver somniferum]|uniref:zinc finger BED domain-containing protein RICESLEEPER 2-like n=1 Tax=Papaver somniferum TaxID=3469 RepID=UPI000E6FFAB9|nr:zinc finger BED domain-containing protein RICESLEEPER 2-like [Papaver somniferum]